MRRVFVANEHKGQLYNLEGINLEPHLVVSLGAFVVEKEADVRAIVAFSLATEEPLPEVQHELPLANNQRGDLYLRRKDGTGPRVIIEFKHFAIDHFAVKGNSIYTSEYKASLPRKQNGTIVPTMQWTSEQKRKAISFLKDFGDNFDNVTVSYNHGTQKTTSEMRKEWAAEAGSRVASYRAAYGSKALRVLSVTVFPTGHTRVDLVADVPGDAKDAAPKAPEATLQAHESSAMTKKVPKKARASKKSGM